MIEPVGKRPATARLIAVVDDDYRVLESLDDLLQSSGYRTQLHTSAESLLQSAALGSVDALISDIGLPGMSGIELLRSVRQRLAPPLPTILITGRSETYLEQHAQDLGVLRFFTKPFDTQELLAALDRQFRP
jgi:FixJ family two-component response regulator